MTRTEASWVPAEKHLPMGGHDVICSDLEGIWIGHFAGKEWMRDEAPVDVVVTHWMELPELPNEYDQD